MQSLVPDRDSCFRIASMSAKGPLTFLRLSFLNHKITAGMQQVLIKCSFPFCTPLGMEERGAEARMLRGEKGWPGAAPRMAFSGEFRAPTPFQIRQLSHLGGLPPTSGPGGIKCGTPRPSQGPAIPMFLPA